MADTIITDTIKMSEFEDLSNLTGKEKLIALSENKEVKILLDNLIKMFNLKAVAPLPIHITDTDTFSDGLFTPVEQGTYTNLSPSLTYDPAEGLTFFVKSNGVWTKNVTPIDFTPTGEVKLGDLEAVSGDEVYKKVVNKTDVNVSGLLDYTAYIVNNVTIDSNGNTVTSINGKIVQDMPVDESKGSITLDNIVADDLKKIFFKDSQNNRVGSIVGLSEMPYTSPIPANAKTVSFSFIRNVEPDKTLMPIIYYTGEPPLTDKILGYDISAKSLNDNNNVPDPINPQNAVNKNYFDINAVKNQDITSIVVPSSNKLNRGYIQQGKYINSAGEVLPSGSQHIVQNHPVSEYAGLAVTFNGYIPTSIKKLVFRDSSGLIVGSISSLIASPFTVYVPGLAHTFDMSIKSSADDISSYDELRMNIGIESLPFEPFYKNLISEIKGIKIYAEKSKEGGEAYDQSLNTTDDVVFNSINSHSITCASIQFNLPLGNGTPPPEVEIGDSWIDTTDSSIKVRLV